jgi:aminodeoxyfutalosine synthase
MPLPVPFDPARLRDPALRPIAEKVSAGERLSAADGVVLFRSADLLGVGAMADAANRARHGDRVTFAANQHINPTNVCILRKTCVFCSYARLPKEEGAYRYTMDQVWAEASAVNSTMTREFHIVGGLDMQAGLDYYTEMFRGLKTRHPHVHIKALTAVEIAHIARIEKMSVQDVLIALRDAGLDTMPGGGAEVFSAGVRATIADKKLAGEEWIDVHRQAHALGIRSNCTMLYGHVETIEDRVHHLSMLRDLQDETGGFRAFISWTFQRDGNRLDDLVPEDTRPTSFDYLLTQAVSRIYLDNVPHIQSSWVTQGLKIGQVALGFGADDMGSVMIEENVVSAAGTTHRTSTEELVHLIRAVGKTPVQRDTLYREVRVW